MHDGQSVVYCGAPGELQPGDEGVALSVEGTYAHVLWRTGVRAGQASPHSFGELTAVRGHIEASLDDSLEVPLATTSTRMAYDEDGPAGVVEQMSFTGHLSALRDAAEEGFTLVTSRVRSSPYIQSIASQLDESEVEALVQATSATLLRELVSFDE